METQTETMGELFKLQQKKDYPKPENIPRPPAIYEPKPQVTLADLTPNQYANATARIISYRTSERHDELGNKVIFTGLMEDASFRLPFV
jgi:hypothetical protein